MQPSPAVSIEQLKEKYVGSALLNPREEIANRRSSAEKRIPEKKNIDITVSRPSTTSRNRRLSSESSRIFSNRQSFRDVVLKAVDHKPFLERLPSRSQNRLAGLGHQARLEKFRHIASRWQNKARKGAENVDTLAEVDYEVEMPAKPRFCATLSTEAQYAIFKGYEDVLVDKISSSLASNDKTMLIKRIPSATARSKTNSNTPTLPILENKPKIVLISSPREEMGTEGDTRSAQRKRDRDQRYMSTHFKQAMNILDELKHRGANEMEHASPASKSSDLVTAQNKIKQYHAWSQRWAKHFEFSRS